MKVRRVRIGSYGELRNTDINFSPGLNTVYGANEAGKSTLRAFITTAIFSGAKPKYPAQRKSDSGSVDIELGDGSKKTFTKDGKSTDGEGEALCGINAKEYIAIYSMSPDDLRNSEALEKGGIRGRFLTVPGGNDLPKATKELKEERTAYLPDLKWNERSGIGTKMKESEEAAAEVKKLQSSANGDLSYSDLISKKDDLERKLKQATADLSNAKSVHDEEIRRETRITAMKQQIAELENKAKALEYSKNANDDTYVKLRERLKTAEKQTDEKEADVDLALRKMEGVDPAKILSCENKIRELSQCDHVSDAVSARRIAICLGICLVMAAVVAICLGIVLLGIALAMVGAVLMLGIGTERISTDAKNLWSCVCMTTGITPTSIDEDAKRLEKLLELAIALRAAGEELSDARNNVAKVRGGLELFLSRFGGEERFLQALKDHGEYKNCISEVAKLRENLPAPGGAHTNLEEYSKAKDAIVRELSATEQTIKDIVNGTTVEEAITRAQDAENDVCQNVQEWARLAIETMILDKACASAYKKHRPAVTEVADRFLSAMTGGRYRLNPDPRENLTVVDSEIKNAKQWSSGLTDQILLSVKMGVALSLSKERPPVILDDVLLTSDGIRKAGAVKALARFSDEIQVIYFTCDTETKNLMAAQGSKVITMP